MSSALYLWLTSKDMNKETANKKNSKNKLL